MNEKKLNKWYSQNDIQYDKLLGEKDWYTMSFEEKQQFYNQQNEG